MSLDVWLTENGPAPVALDCPSRVGEYIPAEGDGKIFIRENGQNREVTRAEWDARFPDREPVVMVPAKSNEVFSANITHNLGDMADAAGLYMPLWCPEEIGISKAHELIVFLREGLEALQSAPDKFRQHNPPNGWGNYEGLVAFVEDYLHACEKHPDADVSASR